MWKEKLSFDDAWRVVHAARPWICPNSGFKRQLFEFEKLECDPGRWHAWRHVEAQQEELQRTTTPSKMVLNKGMTAQWARTHVDVMSRSGLIRDLCRVAAKFCSLEV